MELVGEGSGRDVVGGGGGGLVERLLLLLPGMELEVDF